MELILLTLAFIVYCVLAKIWLKNDTDYQSMDNPYYNKQQEEQKLSFWHHKIDEED